jgi:single-stranded-DNA-specific exonuclease
MGIRETPISRAAEPLAPLASCTPLTKIRRRSFDSRIASDLGADNIPAPLARAYAARGVRSTQDLTYSLSDIPDWRELRDIELAADHVARAIQSGDRIVVVSDYDCDGATGCAVMVRGLASLGANVEFVIPLRLAHGYGLTTDIVPQVLKAQPAMVVTVDNGISSVDGIRLLMDAGVKVIVTDHHLAPDVLPVATAIVNPNRPGDNFPSKSIAGVGVAFYMVAGVRAMLDAANWFSGRAKPNLADLLPLVALGTVADVVSLDRTNRILVANGLARMRAGKCPAGIAALAAASGRTLATLATQDLGFSLGPRLNAAGRLKDMALGVRCLVTDDPEEAQLLAIELDQMNTERRSIQATVEESAAEKGITGEGRFSICVAGDWHQGVVGIVAGRLKEQHRRPTVVFADDGEGMMKGSGRSVPGYHLRDALARIDAAHPGMIARFGGHAAAAGMSVKASQLDGFQEALETDARRFADPAAFEDSIETDGDLPLADATLDLAQSIAGGIWGQSFAEPTFDAQCRIAASRIIGKQGKHRKLTLSQGTTTIDAIWFGGGLAEPPAEGRFAFHLGVNEWRGDRTVQAVVVGVG